MRVGEQASQFNSNGVPIRYVIQGEGEPVILLHGFILNLRTNWIAGGVLDALSRHHRVAAFDLRGHGESGKPHEPQSYGMEMVHDVIRLMDHLNMERAHVVGYSLGGILALKLIETAPKRLHSLVVGGADWIPDRNSASQKWGGLTDLMRRIQPGESISSYFWPDGNGRPPREIREVIDNNDARALAAVSSGMMDVTVSVDVLRSNCVPILALFGENDPIQSSGAAMKAVAKNFTMQVVPGLDHHTLAGSPEFPQAIRQFITR